MVSSSSSAMARHLLMSFFLVSCVAAADEVRRELTTRSWDAISFHEDVKRSPLEEDIIIGVMDSGIWPESPSFSDLGLPPPPKKWKGICQPNDFNFTCNNKIIGARFYLPDPRRFHVSDYASVDEVSPRDVKGHGTHVAATVAGVPVKGVSVNGLGLGTARGALPRARIAVYKICWNMTTGGSCFSIDNAIDDAVRDGVDIITLSIGRDLASSYNRDRGAIAAFNAMRQGVLVSYSAGNAGPKPFLMDNLAPWMLTVGNSFTGPEYATFVKLGNGKSIKGQRLMQKSSEETQLPLVAGWEVNTMKNDSNLARVCSPENLDSKLIQGKIILCPSVSRYNFGNITAAGIIFDAGGELYEDMRGRYYAIDTRTRTLPVIGVTGEDFAYLLGYYNETTGNATASILKTEEIKNESPPFPAMSSSRGPNLIDPTIMKPDLSAPGVNIIAAVIGNPASFDCRTGTSMATPHASGIAGYVKTFHPSWSPSAIKSALLTTATPMINDKYNNVSELAYGAGNLNPVAAVNPGLVYDLQVDDYVKYLCKWSQNYDEAVKNITRDPNVNCSSINMEENWSLNLPTFSIPAKPNTPFIKVFRRSVKNVGSPISNYKSIVSAPAGVEIQLQPSVLSFEKLDQVLSYDVTIKGQIPDNSTVLSASLVWTDGHHHVRSPIVIFPEFDINAVYKKIVEDLMAGMHAADPDDLLTIV